MADPIDVVNIVQRILPLAALIDAARSARDPDGTGRLFARLVMYQELSMHLRSVAEKQTYLPDGVLRAQPIEGEVDHKGLSREFMARFPKIRAALAK